MYLLTSLLLLSGAFSVFAQSFKHPACPDDGFKYVYISDKQEWVGIGWAWTTYGYRLNNITLQVEFATAELPDTTNLGSLKVLNFYPVKNSQETKEWTIVYEVKFPIQEPLPNVTKIVWNDQVICYDPQSAFTEEKPFLVQMRLRYNDFLEEQTYTTQLLTEADSATEDFYDDTEEVDTNVDHSTSKKFKTYNHPECPDSGLKFIHTNDGWMGIGWAWTNEGFRLNNLVLEIELATGMPENSTDLGSLKVLNFYPVRSPKNEPRWNIVYEIKFPMQDPLPDVIKIVWNDETICYDPKTLFSAEKPFLVKMRAKYNNKLEEQTFNAELITKSNHTTTFPTVQFNVGVSNKKDSNFFIPERFNHPPCTDDGVKLIYLNQEVGWIALGWAWTSENYRFHDLTLDVDLATAMLPNTTFLGSLKVLTFYRVRSNEKKKEWNVAYEIRFPIQDPLPDITKIVWNDQTLCYDYESIYTPQKPYLIKMRLRYNDYLEEQTFTTELVGSPHAKPLDPPNKPTDPPTKPVETVDTINPAIDDSTTEKQDVDLLLEKARELDVINEVTPLSNLESTTNDINQSTTE